MRNTANMNIYETIEKETSHFRDRTAVIEGEHTLTYGQLISLVDEIAVLLRGAGICQFDRVALLCGDSIEYIAASLAVLSVSAVAVPVATEHREAEIDEILESMAINYLIFERGSYGEDRSDKLDVKNFSRKEFFIMPRESRKEMEQEYFKINPAFIRFSSGTTGASKGVVLSHETIIERTAAADRGLTITHNDTVLWVLSMSFHFVVTILLFLRRGAAIMLCGTLFPESFIDGILKHKGTFIYASPFHYSLLAHMESLSPESLQNIRLAVSTAMKLPEEVAREFHAKFGFELSEAYGIIEAGLPFINLSSDKSRRNSVGKALPGYEVQIVNKDKDGVGQIHIKGKGMLDAYFSPWQNRENILDADGWFHTGDLGRIDEEGYLTIEGRDKDVINFAGMKVFPHEVESVLNQFPGISESCVYGKDHGQYGQLPVAKVVLKEPAIGVSMEDLRRFCYQRLSKYKVPKDFECVPAIPKTGSGKIRR